MAYTISTPDRAALCGRCGQTGARHIWGPQRASMAGTGCDGWQAPAVAPAALAADPATAVAIGREAFAEGLGAVDAVVEWQLARERLHERRLAECPPGFYTDGAAATPSSF